MHLFEEFAIHIFYNCIKNYLKFGEKVFLPGSKIPLNTPHKTPALIENEIIFALLTRLIKLANCQIISFIN